jgi:hypothetical protein
MTPADRRASAYASTLTADDYLEEARQALRDGDDDTARHCLEVLRGLIEVAAAQLRASQEDLVQS